MTDERHDDEVLGRALSRAIETQSPNETPFERSRIGSAPARRGFPIWQTLGVAAALVLALAFGSWFTRPTDTGPVAASPTASATAPSVAQPSASASPSPTTAPTGQLRVFFVRDLLPPVSAIVPGRPTESRAEQNVVSRINATRDVAAVPAGAANPLAPVGRSNPSGSSAPSFNLAVSIAGDTATVEFDLSTGWNVHGAAEIQGLVQQLVYVITEEPGIRKAHITEKGKTNAIIGGLIVDRPLSREDVTDYDQLGSTKAAQGFGDTNTAVPHKLTSRVSVNTVAPGMARLVIETDLQVPLPNAIYPDFKVEVAQNNEFSTPPLPGKWRMTVTVNGQDSAVFGSNPSSTYRQIDESPVRGMLTTKQGTSTVYQIGLDDLRPWRTAMAWNPMRIVVDIGGDPRTIVDSNAVYAPAYGASVGRTFQVSGVAHNFEAHVVIRVLDDKQKEILKTFATAANCCDPGGTFDATVQLSASVTGNIVLEVLEASAKDGSDLKLIRIPLTVR